MRVFVTGASGFIGQAVVSELIGAGHQVIGLARSVNAARKLANLGAKTHAGSLDQPDTLRAGAAGADGVIHLAFIHGPGDIPLARRLGLILGGSPSSVVERFGTAITAADRRAIDALAGALEGSGRPLVTVFGTMGMAGGERRGKRTSRRQLLRVGCARRPKQLCEPGQDVASVRLWCV